MKMRQKSVSMQSPATGVRPSRVVAADHARYSGRTWVAMRYAGYRCVIGMLGVAVGVLAQAQDEAARQVADQSPAVARQAPKISAENICRGDSDGNKPAATDDGPRASDQDLTRAGDLQAEIDRALPGDVVTLESLVYPGNIFLKEGVVVVAREPGRSTIQGTVIGATNAVIDGVVIAPAAKKHQRESYMGFGEIALQLKGVTRMTVSNSILRGSYAWNTAAYSPSHHCEALWLENSAGNTFEGNLFQGGGVMLDHSDKNHFRNNRYQRTEDMAYISARGEALAMSASHGNTFAHETIVGVQSSYRARWFGGAAVTLDKSLRNRFDDSIIFTIVPSGRPEVFLQNTFSISFDGRNYPPDAGIAGITAEDANVIAHTIYFPQTTATDGSGLRIDATSRGADPLLADPTAGNFRLRSQSPALGHASDGTSAGAVQLPWDTGTP